MTSEARLRDGKSTSATGGGVELRYRFVAIDVDGTLVQRGRPVAAEVKDAIGLAQNSGALVTLASGRMYPLVAPLLRELGLTAPAICYGGAMIVEAQSGHPIFERGVPLELAREVVREARASQLTARAYVGNSVYVDRLDPDAFNADSLRRVNAIEVGDLLDFLTGDPSHLAIDAPPEQTRDVVRAMRGRFVGRLNVTTGHPLLTEFSHPDVHKGSALAWLCDVVGIPIDQAIAIGDDWNDIEMLRLAGVGIAVANAHPDVLAIADDVVPSVDEGGVAVAIQRYVLAGAAATATGGSAGAANR
jgi:Cof subfamily protein (haloacid dehalogenase superfamily)